jgi:hypothetical protein
VSLTKIGGKFDFWRDFLNFFRGKLIFFRGKMSFITVKIATRKAEEPPQWIPLQLKRQV